MPSNTLIHADIFFFVATVGFAVLAIACLVFLLYAIIIAHNVKRLTEKIESGVATISEDAKDLVTDIRESILARFFLGKVKKEKRSKE